ncbi:hypothetical protein MMC07_008450 [Pseudocyphellaria aurata]|nr:hypothetical protein [Pseudocyphellaria aurata]
MTNPMDSLDSPPQISPPSLFRSTLGFLLVGMAWGLTTPFIRRAAVNLPASSSSSSDQSGRNWLQVKIASAISTALDLLRTPAYLIPLVINLTGSIWFFLLVGKAELSLTVPITNSLAFLFTVLGEWWAEGKIISRDTWLGMGLVLGGIALCVQSKSS